MARPTYLSRKTAEFPKARSASPCASSSIGFNSSSLLTTRIPRPPPPNAALIIKGKPILRPHLRASAGLDTAVGVAGNVGTPASSAAFFAATLSPILSSNSGRGPIKVIPASSQARAKWAFSDKKP